ncbi:MAG: SirB1 family protein [Gammaproteobacteria bacterium]
MCGHAHCSCITSLASAKQYTGNKDAINLFSWFLCVGTNFATGNAHGKNLLRLNAAVTRPDGLINLAEAALLFAQSEYPELRVDTYLSRLDEMAAVVKKRLVPGASLASVIFKLNRFLFEEQGFAANIDEYYDPRNSFLNEVLERKTGIPISLSMIYIEIGQRIGLPLTGVLFPGHFLVKLSIDGGDIVLDPFAGGRSLSEQDLLCHLSNLMDFHPSDPIDLTRLLARRASATCFRECCET